MRLQKTLDFTFSRVEITKFVERRVNVMTSYINSDPEHEEEDPEAEEDGRPKGDQQLLEQISGELSTGHLVAGGNCQGHTTHLYTPLLFQLFLLLSLPVKRYRRHLPPCRVRTYAGAGVK